jgi:hypothetical protein
VPRSSRRDDARPFQRFPGEFEQQPLLRVHRQRLARADPEEARVEVARLLHEAALAHIGGARLPGVSVVEVV